MNCTGAFRASTVLSRPSAASLLKTVNGKTAFPASRPTFTYILNQHRQPRCFSTSRPALIKEFFPAPDAPNIKTTEHAWKHPVYTKEQMDAVTVAHRKAETTSDYVAISLIRIMRWGFDLVTRYKHDPTPAVGQNDVAKASRMTPAKWLVRRAHSAGLSMKA